jgi:hypothetical protein
MGGDGRRSGSPSRSSESGVVDPPVADQGKYCCYVAFAEKDGLGRN